MELTETSNRKCTTSEIEMNAYNVFSARMKDSDYSLFTTRKQQYMYYMSAGHWNTHDIQRACPKRNPLPC